MTFDQLPTDIRTGPTGRQKEKAAAARDRADRTAAGLSELLARRPELRGVHAPADWLDDAPRWST
jgi:hypothetical protein